MKVSSSGGSIPVLSKAVLPGHISCLVSCISVSMIIAIQIGAVDEGAVFNKSIYGLMKYILRMPFVPKRLVQGL